VVILRIRDDGGMTVTFDSREPAYLQEKDTRDELARVFDVCNGCRRCVDRCTVFPTMFTLIERHEDRDAGRMTPAEQDAVVDPCFDCGRCAEACPYAPGRSELAIDVPRLVIRARAMRRRHGQVGLRELAAEASGRRAERLGGRMPAVANLVVGARPGSLRRRLAATLGGQPSTRMLPPYARTRFTTWFRRRPPRPAGADSTQVALFPTCMVEHHAPEIGRDLVGVLDRQGIDCSLAGSTGCCGASLLHAGDLERFAEVVDDRVRALAADVRAGRTLRVAQPTCALVIRREYPAHCSPERRDDAELVAAHAVEATEHLAGLLASGALDTSFDGDAPERVVYHLACHARALGPSRPGVDLLRATGAVVHVAEGCAGPIGAPPVVGAELGSELASVAADVVVGDCHLANTAILERTGRSALHPVQVLARAYGMDPG